MAFSTGPFVDRELVDQCDQIRAIASKNWLNSAQVSLKHLDQVKASVYNVGLRDAKDLRATNLSSRPGRSQSFTDLTTDPPISTVSLQQRTAWGSNGSIPDMLSQSSRSHGLSDGTRPYKQRSRPASAKVSRPSSAKESQLPPKPPNIGVKGARYDPSGRPPKHNSTHTGTGWVGPPAGMKYPDQDDINHVALRYVSGTPPAPCGTPVPPPAPFGTPCGSPIPPDHDDTSSYVKDGRVESISVHIPQANFSHEEDSTVRLSLTHNTSVPTPPPKPVPEPIHLALPTMEDDAEDSDLDTERLIAKASEHTGITTVKTEDLPGASSQQSSNYQETMETTDHTTSLPQSHMSHDNFSTSNQEGTYSYLQGDVDSNSHLDWTDDDDDLPIDCQSEETTHNATHIPERYSVKFSEEKNVTFDITPRNLGHKVCELENSNKISDSELRLAMFVTGASGLNSHKNVDNFNEVNQHRMKECTSNQQNTETAQKSREKIIKNQEDLRSKSKCEKRLSSPERPRSALKPTNRSPTPVATVTVSYHDEEKEEVKKTRRKKKLKEKDIVTMVQDTRLSDEEDEAEKDEAKDDFTPDKLEPWMPTKCVSEPIKNYYEIARHTGANAVPVKVERVEPVSQVFKTTKTLEFDELKPKETNIRSLIDSNQLLSNHSKEREKFIGLTEANANHLRSMSRPMSAGGPVKHSPGNLKAPHARRPSSAKVFKVSGDFDRPNSRMGYVAMAPDQTGQSSSRMLRRPLSANKQARPVSASSIGQKLRAKENSADDSQLHTRKEEKTSDSLFEETDNFFSSLEKQREKEREKQIDELINKHLKPKPKQTLADDTVETEIGMSTSDSVLASLTADVLSANGETSQDETESKTTSEPVPGIPVPNEPALDVPVPNLPLSEKPVKAHHRPFSADHVHHKCIRTVKTNKPPEKKVSNIMLKLAEDKVHKKLNENHRHYASYSRGRVKSAPVRRTTETKIRYAKPTFINSRNPDNDVITDADIETHLMSEKLKEDGIHIRAETLERALYPPSGRSTYYEINATLPKSTSLNLLSHPKVWLPVEYKKFKLAEKNLDKANEIMHRQRLAEERRTRLAELGAAAAKKKKKGKKKGTLRRSKSIC